MWAELVEAAANGDKKAQRIVNLIGWAGFVILIGVAGSIFFLLFQLYMIMNATD